MNVYVLLHYWDDDESSGAEVIGVFTVGADAVRCMIDGLQSEIDRMHPDPTSVYGRSGTVGIKDGCCDYWWRIEQKEVM